MSAKKRTIAMCLSILRIRSYDGERHGVIYILDFGGCRRMVSLQCLGEEMMKNHYLHL